MRPNHLCHCKNGFIIFRLIKYLFELTMKHDGWFTYILMLKVPSFDVMILYLIISAIYFTISHHFFHPCYILGLQQSRLILSRLPN